IQKYYRKDSVIINPPVDLPAVGATLAGAHNKGFYLTGGRLARAKRYDIAIEACNKLKLPLKVFGRDFAGSEAELKSLSGPTIEFLGEITQSEKAKLFASASGYFFCSDNEDFGIVSVEAQGYGCPVIGYASGGIKETVVDGKTGVLFNDLTVDSCVSAIRKVGALLAKAQTRKACIANAQQFSKEKFVAKIKKLLVS
ncbi:MAG: glycosyltransferase, partial [Candidatus Shapirobacteria bacterium]|nr:glycosyltransferase [Candidatus Shapirobacteria bacterium]